MVLWLLSACYFVDPEGGQQGEDLRPDDTSPVLETGSPDDDSASVDSGGGPSGYTGSLELKLDGAACVGDLSLDEDGDGAGSCSTGEGLTLELVFDGTRTGDALTGTTEPAGTFGGTYAGDLVEGTVQGAADGRSWDGVFSASR